VSAVVGGLGCFDVIAATETLPTDYEAFKYKPFAKRSLLTKSEVIDVLVKVKTECNKVAQMSLFHTPVMKSMRLEEFEQAQSQASSQVCCYLYRCVVTCTGVPLPAQMCNYLH